jgi:hypothetical protein
MDKNNTGLFIRCTGKDKINDMSALLTQEKLEELAKLANSVVPQGAALKGQGEIARILKNRGFGIRQIARFLSENGVPCSVTAVANFFKNHEKTN